MALTPGTVAQFDGSLADQIERAFAAELWALKQKEMPDTGKDERRILFAAVAQAVLGYLAENASDLKVTVGSGANQQNGTVQVNSPRLTATKSGTSVTVSGFGFPASRAISVSREEPHADLGSSNTDFSGTFSKSISLPGVTGWVGISADDGQGHRAIATVNL